MKKCNDCLFKSHFRLYVSVSAAILLPVCINLRVREVKTTTVGDCDGNKIADMASSGNEQTLVVFFGRVVQQMKLFTWFLWPGCTTRSVVPSRPLGAGEAVNGVKWPVFFSLSLRLFDIGS